MYCVAEIYSYAYQCKHANQLAQMCYFSIPLTARSPVNIFHNIITKHNTNNFSVFMTRAFVLISSISMYRRFISH